MLTDEEIFDHRISLVEKSISQYGAYLQSFLLKLTRNREDAEELFDDLFVHVLHRFEEEDILKLGYLRRKARQLYIDYWRKQQRNPVTAEQDVPEVPTLDNMAEPGTAEEEAAFKARFFAEHPDIKLTDQQRDALFYHCRDGRTFLEIGELMGKPPSTVGDWIKAAKMAFAEAYNKR